jgi:hypothetical protein
MKNAHVIELCIRINDRSGNEVIPPLSRLTISGLTSSPPKAGLEERDPFLIPHLTTLYEGELAQRPPLHSRNDS